MISLFQRLLALYQLLLPYIAPDKIAAVLAAIEKTLVDYQGGNYAQVLADLAAALKVILPADAAPIIDAHCDV